MREWGEKAGDNGKFMMSKFKLSKNTTEGLGAWIPRLGMEEVKRA